MIMSRIRSRNTRPELIIRRFLWSKGFRYRLYMAKLPGRPDLVISKIKVAIFVNGCFWHGHEHHRRTPQTNAEYWQKKIEANIARDIENGIKLRNMGWTVITIWECELTPACRQHTLQKLLETLRLLSLSARPKRKYLPAEQQLPLAAEGETQYKKKK